MNSQYAPADCSLIFRFLCNYDRSCVYSNSTVGAAAHCFTDVILQDTDLSIRLVPLDSTNSLTGVLTHWFTGWGKIIIFVGDKKRQYYYSKFSYYQNLLELHLSVTH